MRAVQITRFGGPEVLELVDVPEPEAGPGQQLCDVSTAGVNYADTHPRRNPLPEPVRQQPLDHPARLGIWRVQPKTIPPGDGRALGATLRRGTRRDP
jgi:hypothetical protein